LNGAHPAGRGRRPRGAAQVVAGLHWKDLQGMENKEHLMEWDAFTSRVFGNSSQRREGAAPAGMAGANARVDANLIVLQATQPRIQLRRLMLTAEERRSNGDKAPGPEPAGARGHSPAPDRRGRGELGFPVRRIRVSPTGKWSQPRRPMDIRVEPFCDTPESICAPHGRNERAAGGGARSSTGAVR